MTRETLQNDFEALYKQIFPNGTNADMEKLYQLLELVYWKGYNSHIHKYVTPSIYPEKIEHENYGPGDLT